MDREQMYACKKVFRAGKLRLLSIAMQNIVTQE